MRQFSKQLFILFYMLLYITSVFAQNSTYKISQTGKDFIKNKESFSAIAYWDGNGYSVGYGHHGSDVKKYTRVTKSQANYLFNKDIQLVEKDANRLIDGLEYDYQFSQNFFDGLCSLIYNCGYTGIKKSEFYRRLIACRVHAGKMNSNDYRFTIAAVKICCVSSPGHKTRRYEEHLMML